MGDTTYGAAKMELGESRGLGQFGKARQRRWYKRALARRVRRAEPDAVNESLTTRFDNACDAGTCDACNGIGPLAVDVVAPSASVTPRDGVQTTQGGGAVAEGQDGAATAAEREVG